MCIYIYSCVVTADIKASRHTYIPTYVHTYSNIKVTYNSYYCYRSNLYSCLVTVTVYQSDTYITSPVSFHEELPVGEHKAMVLHACV